MDPNEALAEIRYLSNLYWKGRGASVDDILLAFLDLDEWMSRGGFPPDDWRSGGREAERVKD